MIVQLETIRQEKKNGIHKINNNNIARSYKFGYTLTQAKGNAL
jgi:hypothetical protein